ncbi:MAG: SDR family oxidoreductase [Alicyclobacillaceae bacterium]|nr:SDR family oxidoreductase [Alicyclobacillaceae bacterium]
MTKVLEGKKVLITGSGRGIGRACALAMAKAGADVVVHYRRDQDAAERTAAQIRDLGRDAWVARAEMEEPDEIRAMFDEVARRWGRLDVFVANAAASAFKPVVELKPHHLDRTYRTVVHSVVHAVQCALPLMAGPQGAARDGRIIAISSMGSDYTLPRYALLGTAKAALESLVRYLAAELGPRQITCNALCPGVVDTDSARFYAGEQYESYRRDVIAHTPLGRLGTPEDVADAAVFLASDASRFITGQVIRVDGGLTLLTGGFESLV